MSIAETLMRAAYDRSPDVADPRNANTDWRDGYAAGLVKTGDSLDVIIAEWYDRGKPANTDPGYIEWRMGFWSAVYTRLESSNSEAAVSARKDANFFHA